MPAVQAARDCDARLRGRSLGGSLRKRRHAVSRGTQAGVRLCQKYVRTPQRRHMRLYI